MKVIADKCWANDDDGVVASWRREWKYNILIAHVCNNSSSILHLHDLGVCYNGEVPPPAWWLLLNQEAERNLAVLNMTYEQREKAWRLYSFLRA